MFSMTEIKAHSAYKIVTFAPNLILILLSIFAYPYASYMMGFSFVDNLLLKIALSIVAFFILGIVWTYVVQIISFLILQFFHLLFDVSPSKGLTEEESKAVLFGGQAVLDGWEFDRNIREVDYEVVERLSKQGLLGFAFKKSVSKRLWAIVEYYRNNPTETVSTYNLKKVMKKLGITQPWYETAINNADVRNMILQLIFFIYLLLYQPVM